jgi:hypothetical protein
MPRLARSSGSGVHKARLAKHHLGHASGHHLKEAVVEVMVQGPVEHQSVLGIEGSSLLAPAGVMGPQAAHMKQLEPRLRHPHRSWVAKKRGR